MKLKHKIQAALLAGVTFVSAVYIGCNLTRVPAGYQGGGAE